MALKKCPRCELNYILDGQPYCTVCRREMKGERERDPLQELCSVCNENPVLPGKDLCLLCLMEMSKQEASKDVPPVENPLEMEEASEMEEIAIDGDDDIPGAELGEIDRELSLDDIREQEEALDDDEDDQEEL
ncbi:MAG TPA: hypothetical protein IAA66_03900 [Candidatus Avichristensenella intestinipullorum]|uniref:Uncharacterized protein n=1 Tax=Candidatus Avichristensenella intestinipullorum TaxID=2840693 RepID=A0A9D0YXK6_9FIRM|nr:hypothetical protein [Candidatus Avichristensenella intestinipullorum]